MSMVEKIEIPLPATPGVVQVASAAAATDTDVGSKFAIVAPSEITYGLGRMYQSYRELDPRSTKEVKVFRTLNEAVSFLGVDLLEEADSPRIDAADRGRVSGAATTPH
jgi:hypothetical protein